jgi:hypothetical protein
LLESSGSKTSTKSFSVPWPYVPIRELIVIC